MRPIALLMLAPLAACSFSFSSDKDKGIHGEGTGDARTFAATGFDRVDAVGSDDVDVRVGPAFSVRAEGDSDTLDHLSIRLDGHTLIVSRRRGVSFGHATVHVTMPAIAGGAVAGSGNLTIDRADGDSFDGKSAGSGSLAVGALKTREASFTVAGSGDATVAGETAMLKVRVAGSGDVDARNLTATGADVAVMGSGSVTAHVRGAAKVTSAGSGSIDLGPDARCETKRAGSGEVRCGR